MHARHTLGRGVEAAFTDRYGGVSEPPYAELNLGGSEDDPRAVAANRARAAHELGLDAARVVWMRQTHSNAVTAVTGPHRDGGPEVDALVTAIPGLVLAVLVADCTPVLIADPDAGVVCVAHAGRPGLARGIVPALVTGARELGAEAPRMRALIGPAVCGECYEVPREMQDEVAGAVPASRCTTRAGTAGLDVRAGVEAQLRDAGVEEIRRDARCTRESPELYSYRREARTGRFAGYVWLTE